MLDLAISELILSRTEFVWRPTRGSGKFLLVEIGRVEACRKSRSSAQNVVVTLAIEGGVREYSLLDAWFKSEHRTTVSQGEVMLSYESECGVVIV